MRPSLKESQETRNDDGETSAVHHANGGLGLEILETGRRWSATTHVDLAGTEENFFQPKVSGAMGGRVYSDIRPNTSEAVCAA